MQMKEVIFMIEGIQGYNALESNLLFKVCVFDKREHFTEYVNIE